MIKGTFIIGICGLIGSGKSTFIKKLCHNKYPYFDCDTAAKEVYHISEITTAITRILGYAPIGQDGILRKKAIAETISQDPQKRKALEATIHKAVDELIFERCQGQKIMIIESAILFTSGLTKYCDLTVAIDTNREIRRQRVLDRDGHRDHDRFNRIDHLQSEEAQRIKEADIIIHNIDESNIEDWVSKLRHIIDTQASTN